MGATLCKNGACSAEVRIRIASAMAAMARLNTISCASKFKLYKSLVFSILLYGCGTRIPLADSEKRIQAFETKRLRTLFCIFYLEHKTNGWVGSKINSLVGPQISLLAIVQRGKRAWFGSCNTPRQPLQNHP